MAGARQDFSVDIDLGELTAALRALTAKVGAPTLALREIGDVLTASTKRRFAAQTDPDGHRWAPLSPVTLARKTNPRILTMHGYLGDGIRSQLLDGGKAVAVGTDRVYGAAMQFGMAKGYAGTNRRGRPIPWGDIPARPFLGLSAQDRDEIREILADYLARP